MQTRPQKDDGWKIEPLPKVTGISIAELSVPELMALLATAYRRINILEAERNRDTA